MAQVLTVSSDPVQYPNFLFPVKFLQYNQQDAPVISNYLFLEKVLHVSEVLPSIIRSSKPRIQQRYISNSCCYRGWDRTQFHLIPGSSR